MTATARDVDFGSVIDWLSEIRYRTDEGSWPPSRCPTVRDLSPKKPHSQSGCHCCVCVQVEITAGEDEEEVPLRRTSSNQLRQEPGRSKTCFLYPGPRQPQRLSAAVVVRQGPLERVKISSGVGRRLPRSWSRRKYAVLVSDGRLFMSEDANAALESINKSELLTVDSLDVNGAKISRGSTYSTKKNVIELTGMDGRLTLFQNDDGPTTDGWYEALTRIAGPPRGGSLPRAKSMRSPGHHEVGSVQDTTVRSALGRFFSGGRRPTREALEKSGIYRDEPVFGSRLESLCAGPSGTPPQFVRECTRVLGEPPHVLQVGLYRTSGNLSHIQRLRLRVDQNDQKAIAEEQDSDVLAGALKLFFRELREPLIPYAAFVSLLEELAAHGGGAERVRRRISKALSSAHQATLAALCRHLAHVCSYEQQNQMNAQSMAIVWGPSLTWPDDATQDAMLQCTRVNRLIEYLILNERAIF